jgi:hypothetical protein
MYPLDSGGTCFYGIAIMEDLLPNTYHKIREDGCHVILMKSLGSAGTFVESDQQYSVTGFLDGYYNPFWRSQVKYGLNATTSANGSLVVLSPGFIDIGRLLTNMNNPSDHGFYGFTGSPVFYQLGAHNEPVPQSLITNVTNRAIRKFIDAADQARSSIELGQDLGEIKETINAIKHPLQSLREFTFSHLAKVKKLSQTVKHKASLSKMVADTWLEYRFGWRPLALDVGQAYADLVNNNHFDLQPIHGGAYDSFPILDNVNINNLDWSQGGVRIRLTVTGAYSVTYKGAVRTNASGGHIGFQQNMQLDLPHFVPTIWDLLPYSWIADYFTNVGDIIHALCFNIQNLSWGVVTNRTIYDYNWSYTDLNFPPPPINYSDVQFTISSNPRATYTTFQRSAIGAASLLPDVAFTLPLGSWKPWANMAALMASSQKEISRIASNIR